MGKMPQIRKKALPVRFPRNTCSHIFFSLGKLSLSFNSSTPFCQNISPAHSDAVAQMILGRLWAGRLAGYAVQTICRVRRALGGLPAVFVKCASDTACPPAAICTPASRGILTLSCFFGSMPTVCLFTSALQHTLLLAFSHSHGHSRYRHLKNNT